MPDPHPTQPAITDDERGLASRGTEIVSYAYPTLTAPRRRVTTADELAFKEAFEAVKEAWKSAHPSWPYDEGLRRASGFYFSEEEIKGAVLDDLGWVPPIALYVTLIQVANGLRPLLDRALGSGEGTTSTRAIAASGTASDETANHLVWAMVAQIVAEVLTAVALKKIKASKARELLATVFKRLNLDEKVARLAAKELVAVQRTVSQEYEKLLKEKGFSTLKATTQGTKLDEAVKQRLLQRHRTHQRQRSGFWYAFEEPLALGSGEHHEGPNVDVVLGYGKQRLARLDVKLSIRALNPEATQMFMMIHDAEILNTLHAFVTPRELVVLPDERGRSSMVFRFNAKGSILSNALD